MFTKALLAVLTACAFFYALYLILFRKEFKFLKAVEHKTGLPQKAIQLFFLATFIMVNCLSFTKSARSEEERASCYERVEAPSAVNAHPSVIQTLRLVWRTLNTEKSERFHASDEGMTKAIAAFKNTVDKAANNAEISEELAVSLCLIHQKLAYYFWRSNTSAKCYKVTVFSANESTIIKELQAQLTFLRAAKGKGTVSPEVIEKSTQALLQKVEVLRQIDAITSQSGNDDNKRRKEFDELTTQIRKDSLAPSRLTEETVEMILRLEEIEPATTEKPRTGSKTVK